MTLGGWRAEAAGRLDWSVTSTALATGVERRPAPVVGPSGRRLRICR